MASWVLERFSRQRAPALTGGATPPRTSGYQTSGARRRVIVPGTGDLAKQLFTECAGQKQTVQCCTVYGETILVGMGQAGPEPSYSGGEFGFTEIRTYFGDSSGKLVEARGTASSFILMRQSPGSVTSVAPVAEGYTRRFVVCSVADAHSNGATTASFCVRKGQDSILLSHDDCAAILMSQDMIRVRFQAR